MRPRNGSWRVSLFASLTAILLAGCMRPEVTGPMSAPAAANVVVPANAIVVYPGESIQEAVDAHPPGTVFLIKAGVHRLQSVAAKPGNAFIGEPGAILSGARVLTDFDREGPYWVATGQTQQNPRHGPNMYGVEVCWDGSDGKHQDSRGCIYPEDLFLDNRPLRQVTTLSAVEPGSWFFDYDADKIYFADDPAGHLVEVSVSGDAIHGDGTHGVLVQGLVIEKYANAAQRACVDFRNSNFVVIRDNEIRSCHGAGAAISTGASDVIAGNYIHDNGQLGIASFGSVDLVVENNEVAGNNQAGYKSHWEAGGAKFSRTSGLLVRGNSVHDNQGKGIWTDTDDIRSLIEQNVVTANSDHGIYREVGYSAIVRDNTIVNNGWHGIIIDSSPDVEVYGNTVRNNGWDSARPLGQIGARDSDRAGSHGMYGLLAVRNLWVHENTVEGPLAVGVAGPDAIFQSERQNTFDRNRYHLESALAFEWRGAFITAREWQAAGNDPNAWFGQMNSRSDKDPGPPGRDPGPPGRDPGPPGRDPEPPGRDPGPPGGHPGAQGIPD